jgi:hypothetical protein
MCFSLPAEEQSLRMWMGLLLNERKGYVTQEAQLCQQNLAESKVSAFDERPLLTLGERNEYWVEVYFF